MTDLTPHKNWHQKAKDKLTLGERVSDSIAHGMGSWKYVIIQTCIIILWIAFNVVAVALRWDPYPFILLNLAFSMQATYASPLILMAQNRAEQRDKIQAEHQYEHQEQELKINTDLTKEIHDMVSELRNIKKEIK